MDDDDIIAATCLLLSCTTQVAVLMSQKDGIPHGYAVILRRRHHESVYYSLLPDLAELHREKFRQFLRMEFETFEELFQLIEPAIGKFGRPVVCCWFVRLCRSPNSTRPTRPTSWRLVTRKLATCRTMLIWQFFNSFKSTFERNFILSSHVKTIIESR